MRISYDDLAADPTRVLRRILDRLGLDIAAADGVTPSVRKLGDGTNLAWAARFRGENGLG